MSESDEAGEPDVGTLAEEAAKLLGALNGWAREHGDWFEDGISGVAEHVSVSAQDVNEHIATGSAECSICPVCRALHAVRHLSPEVKTHLASAATSLMHAAAGVLATVTPKDEGTGQRADVEHIDLDDTGQDWPESES